ncbi:MAG: alpha/beta hydrolase [Acidimicrobiales bacterium]|nr:alpha/beta hydrolase [Acidimicrobiales bacterium]
MFLEVAGRTVHAATGAVPIEGRDDPLLVLLHGSGMDRSVWSHQTRFLAHHGVRAVAVDLPGHGRSDGPALDTIAELADWTAALAQALGGPLHLVGHSMGALVVLETAGRHHDAVASAVLLGVAAAMPVHPDLQAAAEADDPLAAELITAWAHGRRQHIGLNPTPGLWMMGGVNALLDSSPPGVLATDLAACAAYDEALVAAAGATCPVTLVLGGEDRMTPRRAARDLEAAFPSPPSVVELPGSGHMLMQEEPEAVRRALLDHLDRCRRD